MLETTRTSWRVTQTLTGEDRFWLYVVATSMGFCAGELASLTPRSFAIEARRLVVHLRAEDSKNGQSADQPLRVVILDGLRTAPSNPFPQRVSGRFWTTWDRLTRTPRLGLEPRT